MSVNLKRTARTKQTFEGIHQIIVKEEEFKM